jgi:hypothetical protein
VKTNKFCKEEEFIVKNYPKFGSKYCKNILQIDIKKIMSVVSKYRLKREKIDKIKIDINNKYFCYLLGLIWSDGHVSKITNRIGLSLVEEDINDIKNLLNKVGVWNYTYFDNSRRNYRNQISVRMSDINFKKFLVENDFLEKSFKSPDKIISLIPPDNIKYFIRGISDGDGCFYYNKKQYVRQYCIASTYNQDWSYMMSILDKIDCKFKIEKTKKERSQSSIIRITNKDILKIGEFIYDDFFGLNRKYEKFLIIKESYNILNHKPKYGARKPVKINEVNYTSLKEAANVFGIHHNTLLNRMKRGDYNYEFIK